MNALFIHIPKTAGISIRESLDFRLPIGEGPVRDFDNEGMVTFAHLSVKQLVAEGCISDAFMESAFKFAFVRNPFDRLLSLYFHRQQFDKVVAPMGFIEYLRYLRDNPVPGLHVMVLRGCSKDGLLSEIHRINHSQGQANSQVSWLDVPVDFIGRFERLNEDFGYICDQLGISTVLVDKNKAKGKGPWQEYYDQEARDIVLGLNEFDFDMFGYSTEIQ